MVSNNNNTQDYTSKTSLKTSFFELSTIPIKKLNFNSPYPKELETPLLFTKLPITKDGFLVGFTIIDKEGIVCNDEEIVKSQSGVISDVMKQFTKNFKQGIVSLSLPIKMFEPRSLLERNIAWWSFAPNLLKEASKQIDKIEIMKSVTCFALSALYLSTEQQKPFNPYLGETFQGELDDGTKLYVEHTSHTPCISNFLCIDKDNDYKLFGYNEIGSENALKMLISNTLVVNNKGRTSIYFKSTNSTIDIQFPKLNIGGLIYGKRAVYWSGFLKCEDKANNMMSVVYLGKSHDNLKKKRIHDIYGQIFFNDFSKKKDNGFYDEKIKLPDSKHKIIDIEGSYLEEVKYNNSTYWDFRQNDPHQIIPKNVVNEYNKESNSNLNENSVNNIVLPSDCRYREDLIWLRRSFESKEKKDKETYTGYAQQWKLALEAQKRLDKENRIAYNEKINPKKEKKKKFGIF